MGREFDDIKDGTKLEPYHLNIIYRELRRLRKFTVSPPLALDGMTSTTSQPMLWLSRGPGGTVGLTTSSITARAGSTPGTGSADLLSRDDETGDFVTDEASATDPAPSTIYSYSSTAIATGKYCWLQKDYAGDWWVISVEC